MGIRTALILVFALLLVAWSATVKSPSDRKYPDRIPVRFWHMWTAEWAAVVEEIAKEYNESQTKYEVIPLSVPSSGADTKFLLGTAGGDPPDVMSQWNPVIPGWAEGGLLTPLDELMSPEEKRIFEETVYPIAKKIGSYNGRLYGMAIGINNYAIYMRPSQFKEAGLDPNNPPKTWEELMAIAEKMHRFDGKKNLKRLGFIPGGLARMAVLFGGGFYDWENEKVTIDTPQNRAALKAIVDSYRKLGYDNVTRFNAGLNTASFAGGWPFIGGAYTMTIDGQWRVEQLRKFAPKLDYKTFAVPPPAGGRKFGFVTEGNFMIVPKGSRNPEGAWDFIKFWSGLTNPEQAAKLYVKGGWLPLNPAIAQAPAYQEYLRKYPEFRTFLDILPSPNLQTKPPVPYQTILMDLIQRAEDRAVRGTVTPDEAIEELERDVQVELDRRRKMGYQDASL